MDKLTEIKESLVSSPLLKAKFGVDGYMAVGSKYDLDVAYLLQLVETQTKALEESQTENALLKKSNYELESDNQDLQGFLRDLDDPIVW